MIPLVILSYLSALASIRPVFFSRFVVKLFTQKPLSFKRCITEKIEIRKSFQISDLDSIGYSRVLKEMSLLIRYFYTQLLILHCLTIVEVKS